jgi:hypothetical protein
MNRSVPIVIGVPDLEHGLVAPEDLLVLSQVYAERVTHALERSVVLPQLGNGVVQQWIRLRSLCCLHMR